MARPKACCGGDKPKRKRGAGRSAIAAHSRTESGVFLNAVFAFAERARRRRQIIVSGLIIGLMTVVVAVALGLLSLRQNERDIRHLAETEMNRMRRTVEAMRRARDSAEYERTQAEKRARRAERARKELLSTLRLRDRRIERLVHDMDELCAKRR